MTPPAEEAFDDITDGGERITPDVRNWGYYAHLSLYSFGGDFVKGARVLDAGCGTGYGCHHLLLRGAASVLGVDISEKAVAFSQSHYAQPGVSFRVMDLCAPDVIVPDAFDVVFCNIGEHLPDVDRFFEFCRQSLSPRGLLVLTVPAVVTPGILEGNLGNPYHVTLLPPQGWFAKLSRYFFAVQGFRHWVAPQWLDETNFPIDMALPPEETQIRETDFRFIASSAEELSRQAYNISLVILACVPRPSALELVGNEPDFPEEWNVEDMRKRMAARR